MVRVANRQFDLAVITSWHTARFALNGYADKGRLAGNQKLSDLLSSAKTPSEADVNEHMNAKIIHFFQQLKARGASVEITRTVN